MLEIDPRIAEALASSSLPPLRAGTLSTYRAGSSKPSAPSPGVERREYVIDPERAVVIRVHRPAGAEGGLPCVYSMHGGGYVFGSYANDDTRLDGWSRSYRCVGVWVDYRLAPETPFPGPLDDCYLGLKWVFDHHDELGVNAERIGVSGTSAGAGLAAGLALLARDRGEVPLQFQLLDAPMIDDRQATPSSQRDDLVIFDRGDATTPSGTPPGSTRPAWRPNCTSTRAPRTGSSNSRTFPSPAVTPRASTGGSAAQLQAA